MLTLHITPDVLVSGIIGHMEIAEASKLQMQILIPASLSPSSRKEGYVPFKIVIEKDNHVHSSRRRMVFFGQLLAHACNPFL